MTDQLELLPAAPPRLTARQELALAFIQACGNDGATAAEIGEHLGGHPQYHRSNGMSVAKALRKRELIRGRRGGLWVAVDAVNEPAAVRGMLRPDEPIPY